MPSLPRLLGVLSPLPILLACASTGARDPNVITAPELSRSEAPNTYDAIRRIRPEMLRDRDHGTLVYFKERHPVVAVDQTVVGGVEVLRTLPAGRVARIEYINSWEAAKRYGTGFENGVMLIETRADSQPDLAVESSSSR
ncbi:MAG TPA: hypothetical protein VIQ27_13745 [Gemmatimonadales bacterium]|jgi:hypothetical protein